MARRARTSLQLKPTALRITFLGPVHDRQSAVSIFEARCFQHQAANLSVEVHEKLLSDGSVVIEQLGVLSSIIEPHKRVWQIKKGDPALADDLQVGRSAERG